MRRTLMTRWATIGFVLTFGLAACGGSGSDAPATQGATSPPDASAPAAEATAPPAEATSPPDATSAPGGDPDVGPLNVAVVTIGDERYEFTDVQCSIFAPRYIQAGNFGGDPEVSIVLPPDGWESEGDTYSPPSVRVSIGDGGTGQTWLAGDDGLPLLAPIPEGSSQIDSYTVPDGRPVKATGTATFIDVVAHNNGADAPSVSGSFEVSCP
jgi:hypothetical protein